MPSHDLAAISAPAANPSERKKQGLPKRITPQISEALHLMVTEGLRYQQAAERLGIPMRSMRSAIERPHVLSELKRRKEVFRASICGGNIHRLAEIRDAAKNMPAVNAIKELERMGEVVNSGSIAGRLAPGLVIQVMQIVQSASPSMNDRPADDAKPLIEHDAASHDD